MSRELLRERIMAHEGLRFKPYKDTLGKLTIGYGRCLDTQGITEGEAEYLLDNDLQRVEDYCLGAWQWFGHLDDTRQGVVMEMVFQLGLDGVRGFSRFLAAVGNADYTEAGSQMRNSLWARQTPGRAEVLARIMETGQDPTTSDSGAGGGGT